jgi:hypothetical protein
LAEGQKRLVPTVLEPPRNPEMQRRVREHLEARGDSPRDLISAALVAARFHREQNWLGASNFAPARQNSVPQPA